MSTIRFEGENYALEPGESVLKALRRQGVEVPSSCESGVCQTCMMKALRGAVPDGATKGLRQTQREQGYFLACVCTPEADLEVARVGNAATTPASIVSTTPLSDTVLKVQLRPNDVVDYRAGQFMTFVRADGLSRSYSIASVAGLDDDLEFHVALLPNGRMSGWLHAEARPRDELGLIGPLGTCFYTATDPDQPLLLAGTGTGLAPLYGIARDALRQGHRGPIHLFHGALTRPALYLVSELRRLDADFANFHYYPCVLNGPAEHGVRVGAIDAYLREMLPDLKGHRVYLCGHPDTVKLLQKKTFLAGARMQEIYADAFLPSAAGAA